MMDRDQTMQRTSQALTQVSASARQVRSIGKDMAAVAQEQSAAVREVAKTIEKTNGQVMNSAERARAADRLAAEASALADVGQTKMNALADAMEAIEASAKEIGKIVKVIDDIAVQTNLLALNAAGEAARAGEPGRGFAVVAQEVRILAERSADAAKSTEDLIEGARQRMRQGVQMANATGAALAGIVTRLSAVKELVGEIATTGREQACSLQQISPAMMQLNDGAQSSQGQSEELARTADELADLAERLETLIAQFKLRQAAESPDAMLHLESILALDRRAPGELELETWQALQAWVRSNTPEARA